MAVLSDYRALLADAYWYPGSPSGRAVFLTYSFLTQPPLAIRTGNSAATASFRAFGDAEKNVVRQAIAAWATVSGITFVETTRHEGDLTFGYYDLATVGSPGAGGVGAYPQSGAYYDGAGLLDVYSGTNAAAGDVKISLGYLYGWYPFSDLKHVLLHEIGHALGLKHPFEGPNALDPARDNGSETVMSYTAPRSDTLGPLDIDAIRALYGTPSGATRVETWSWDADRETFTARISGANLYLRGVNANNILYADGPDHAVVSGEGNDIIHATSLPISINAGDGTDKVYTGLSHAGLRFGVGGSSDFRYISLGGGAFQTFINVEQLRFTDGVYYMANDRFAPLRVAIADTTNHTSSTQPLSPYAGPVPYLDDEFIYAGTANINLSVETDNVFLKSQGGQDALQAHGGHNVLDGGTGSNFLVGGQDADTFFVDGRAGGVTWSTIAGFGALDDVTLWGWLDGTTRYVWDDRSGAAGFEGLTLHADLGGTGRITASMTFTGLTAAQRDQLHLVAGVVEGNSYLHITLG